MGKFGGFDSRQLQNNYNKSLFALLFLLSNTLLKFFDGEKCDQVNFQQTLTKVFGRMITLEAQKPLPPKFSRSIGQLVKFLSIEVGEEQISQHEASVIRLMSIKSSNAGYGSSLDVFDQNHQNIVQGGFSLEPLRSKRFESAERKHVPNKLENEKGDTSQISPQRSNKKRLNKSLLNETAPRLEQSPQQQKSPLQQHLSQVFDEVVNEIPAESHRTDDENAASPYIDTHTEFQRANQRSLNAHQSIHTIQEYEQTQETDYEGETLNESNYERSTGHRLQKQLDSEMYIKNDVQAQVEILSPSVTDSPLKGQSLAHNEQTIQKKNAMDQIMSRAKKEYQTDKVKQKKVGDIANADDFYRGPNKTIVPSKKIRTIQHLEAKNLHTRNVTHSPRIRQNETMPTVIHREQQSSNRNFLKKIRQRQAKTQSAVCSDAGEVERLKKFIFDQHIANQEKIREHHSLQNQKHHRTEPHENKFSKPHVPQPPQQPESKGRVRMRKLVAESRQPRTEHMSLPASFCNSIDVSDAVRNGKIRNSTLIQDQITRQRQLKDTASLDDGLRYRRKFVPRMQGTRYPENVMRSKAAQDKRLKNQKVNISSERGSQDGDQQSSLHQSQDDLLNEQRQKMYGSNETSDQIRRSVDVTDPAQHQELLRRNLPKQPLEPIDKKHQERIRTTTNNPQRFQREPRLISLEPLTDHRVQYDSSVRPIQEYIEDGCWPTMQNKRPQRKVHGGDVAATTLPMSSGGWRQPVGGASVGLVDDTGENALSSQIQIAPDIRSQAYINKPHMMYNTMHGVMQRRDGEKLQSLNNQHQQLPPSNGEAHSYYMSDPDAINNSPQYNNDRNRLHVKPETGCVEEPSLPQFPPSSLEANSLRQIDTPLIAQSAIVQGVRWKKSKTALRNSKQRENSVKESLRLSNQAEMNVISNNESRQGQQQFTSYNSSKRASMAAKKNQTAFSVTRHHHSTNNSQSGDNFNAGGAREGRDQMINHYQMRLHTRGPSYTVQNNEDLTATVHNPAMVRTVQDWRSLRNSLQGRVAHHGVDEGDVEIDSGVQMYIVSQQGKRKQVQTSNARQLVNQTQSVQDRREIFSEEDFCNPDFHKFRLPQFSREHHESLFERQKQKLQQQRQQFEDKAIRSSMSRASQSQMRLGDDDGFHDGPVLESSYAGSQQELNDWKNSYSPEPLMSRQKTIDVTACSVVKPLSREELLPNQHFQTLPKQRKRTKFYEEEGAYETTEEVEQLLPQPKKKTTLQQHRLSQEVAALINDSNEDDDDDDELQFQFGVDLDRQSDEHALKSFERQKEPTQPPGECVPSQLQSRRSASQAAESAPDKDIFQNSERLNTHESVMLNSLRESTNDLRLQEATTSDLLQNEQQKQNSRGMHHQFMYSESPPRVKSSIFSLDNKQEPDSRNQQMFTIELLKDHKKTSGSLLDDYMEQPKHPHPDENREDGMFRLPERISTINSLSENSEHSKNNRRSRIPKRIQQRVSALKRKQESSNGSRREANSSKESKNVTAVADITMAILASSQKQDFVEGDQPQLNQAQNNCSYVVEEQYQSQQQYSSQAAISKTKLQHPLQQQELMIPKRSNIQQKKQASGNTSQLGKLQTATNIPMTMLRNQSQRQNIQAIQPASTLKFQAAMRCSDLSISNRRSLNEAKSYMPKSINSNSQSSHPRLSKLSLDRRQKKQVP